MHVVILTTSYPRFDGDPGGHFVAAQANALTRAGAEVQVIASGCAPHVEQRGGIEVHWVGGTTAFGMPGVAARFVAAPLAASLDVMGTSRVFARKVRELTESRTRPPDRVLAHWLVPTVWPALLRLRYEGRVDAFAHGGDVRLLVGMPEALRHAVVSRIVRRATSLHFASHSLAELLLGSVRDPAIAKALQGIARVDPPTLEIPQELHSRSLRRETRARWHAEWPLPANAFVAVAVGRLVDSKRVDLAIDALQTNPTTHLVVIGDGPARHALEARAEKHGQRVRFAGMLHRREALTAMAAADVLVHPSALEAAPSVVREARALGIPVVACGAGDIPRWATEDAAIRCVEHDAVAIAAAIRELAQTRDGIVQLTK